MLSRLAAASVVCTPFWLPIFNDWHAWSTGLVITLGEVPLIGFTLLAAPKTIRSLTAKVTRAPQHFEKSLDQRPERPKQEGAELRGRRSVDPYLTGLVVLLVALGLSTIVHLHPRGLQILFRLFGMICLADHAIRGRIRSAMIAHAFVGITAFEAAVAIWQRITHAPVGLSILGESPVPYYAIGRNAFSVCGTFPHPYPLAALGLLGGAVALSYGARQLISHRMSLLGGFSGAIIVGLTVSRAGLLSAAGIAFGLLAAVVVSVKQRQGRTFASVRSLIVFLLGLALGIAMSYGAWTFRATSQKVGTLNEMTSSRMDLVNESIDLYKLNPLFGVGAGRYSIELSQHPEIIRFRSPGDVLPVHNAPLLFLAEGGVLSLLGLVVLALVIGQRLTTLGPIGIIFFSSVVPFLMLDIVYTVLPSGLFLLGVWGSLISSLKAAQPLTQRSLRPP